MNQTRTNRCWPRTLCVNFPLRTPPFANFMFIPSLIMLTATSNFNSMPRAEFFTLSLFLEWFDKFPPSLIQWHTDTRYLRTIFSHPLSSAIILSAKPTNQTISYNTVWQTTKKDAEGCVEWIREIRTVNHTPRYSRILFPKTRLWWFISNNYFSSVGNGFGIW